MEAQPKTVEKRLDPAESAQEARRKKLAKARTVISVKGVDKTFLIPHHRQSTLKERVLHPFRRIPKQEVHAARNVSFEVREGEFLGIVGRNGSGKTTLLTMLAGIYQPDEGEIDVKGRISPFIALGVGFNMEMPAKDNIIINGTLLGLRRSEILERYDDIIKFAGLEEFTELRLKNYSSGMLVRLAFSTAIHVDADVLLLDEVLAVGDASFQEKCFEAFRQLKLQGKTIILVTHAMALVTRFCDRAIMLEDGKIVEEGDTEIVGERYRELTTNELHAEVSKSSEVGRIGDGAARVLDTWVEGPDGKRKNTVRQNDKIVLAAAVEFKKDIEEPVFGIQLHRENGEIAFACNTLWDELETPDFKRGERVTFRIKLTNSFGVGTYTISPGVSHREGIRPADIRLDFKSFKVSGRYWTGAAADLPREITLETGTPPLSEAGDDE